MENMKFCKYCGEQIDKSSVICPKCGRQLQVYKETIEQPKSEQKPKETANSKVYMQSWFMWAMLVFFPPIGILLMWKFHPEIRKQTKVILSIIFGLLFLFMIISNINEKEDNDDKIYNADTNINESKKV